MKNEAGVPICVSDFIYEKINEHFPIAELCK